MNHEAPDLVVMLGDFVDADVWREGVVSSESVAARLGRLEAPLGAFAVLGNHDWQCGGERVANALRRAEIAVLEDEALEVSVRGQPLWLAGVGDLRERDPDLDAALAAVPAGEPVLLLSHDPDVFSDTPEQVSLTLSGHTHGGQVNVPVVRRHFIPSRAGDRYAGGHVEEGGRHLFVSRGVGTAGLPLRFRAPPEIAILTLLGAGSRVSSPSG
jgi:predicted MPP superfamily phosphohydrolase